MDAAITSLAEYHSDRNHSTVHVRKTRDAGYALYASRDIQPGEYIAAYPAAVLRDDTITDRTYTITIYKKNGDAFETFSGAPTPTTLRTRWVEGVPAVALFANEPSPAERQNAELEFPDVSSREISRTSRVVARMYATKSIRKGDGIVWCYGWNERSYATSCKS